MKALMYMFPLLNYYIKLHNTDNTYFIITKQLLHNIYYILVSHFISIQFARSINKT